MQFSTILFDLDGTLLPMEQDAFVKAYFGGLAKRLAPHGYDPQELVKGIWEGTAAMVRNDGSMSNESAFWRSFASRFGEQATKDIPLFDAFYREDFDKVQSSCGYTPYARALIDALHREGVQTVLATNPIFPAIATEKRMAWAGLSPSDFTLYTTYENSRFCKPTLAYYTDILKQLGACPEDCLMVGNDVDEDMIAASLGISVFLLTDHLINRSDTPIDKFPHGSFPELFRFLGI